MYRLRCVEKSNRRPQTDPSGVVGGGGLPAASSETVCLYEQMLSGLWVAQSHVLSASIPNWGFTGPSEGAFGFPFSIWLKMVCAYSKLQVAHSIKSRNKIFAEWSRHRAGAIYVICWAIKYLRNHYEQHTVGANTENEWNTICRTICENPSIL